MDIKQTFFMGLTNFLKNIISPSFRFDGLEVSAKNSGRDDVREP
jgi:hypothetical protein